VLQTGCAGLWCCLGCAQFLNPAGDEMENEKKPINQKSTGRGGVRPGSGRPKGRKNLLSAELKELAQSYGQQALETIVNVMISGDSDSIRMTAAKELLDRGYGKPVQANEITGKDGESLHWAFSVARAGSEI